MASITNNHRMTLRLADGTVLKPNEATEVAGWDKQSKNKTVAVWVSAGLLSVDGKAKAADKPEVQKEEAKDDGDDDKATLKAKLDELGIEYDGRASVAKLRELVSENKE